MRLKRGGGGGGGRRGKCRTACQIIIVMEAFSADHWLDQFSVQVLKFERKVSERSP